MKEYIDETISRILSALAYNKINMGTALIGVDRLTNSGTPEQQMVIISELDKFLWDHDGEITEEKFIIFVDKAQRVCNDEKGWNAWKEYQRRTR